MEGKICMGLWPWNLGFLIVKFHSLCQHRTIQQEHLGLHKLHCSSFCLPTITKGLIPLFLLMNGKNENKMCVCVCGEKNLCALSSYSESLLSMSCFGNWFLWLSKTYLFCKTPWLIQFKVDEKNAGSISRDSHDFLAKDKKVTTGGTVHWSRAWE